jgi:hypothetical protein
VGTEGQQPVPVFDVDADRMAVQAVVEAFLDAFRSGPEATQRLDRLRRLFLPQAVVVRTCGADLGVHDVESFIAPREALLTGGVLVDFHEWSLGGRVDVFGDIAAWFGAYAKEGVHDGEPTAGRGMKSVQLVRTPEGWRISAVAWDDERPGLTLPAGSPGGGEGATAPRQGVGYSPLTTK